MRRPFNDQVTTAGPFAGNIDELFTFGGRQVLITISNQTLFREQQSQRYFFEYVGYGVRG